MFHWEPEGCSCFTKYMAIAPFWFSSEHHWTVLMPFWFSLGYTKNAFKMSVESQKGVITNSTMFHWEPEGCYCYTKSVAIVPFWFSMEHHWTDKEKYFFVLIRLQNTNFVLHTKMSIEALHFMKRTKGKVEYIFHSQTVANSYQVSLDFM